MHRWTAEGGCYHMLPGGLSHRRLLGLGRLPGGPWAMRETALGWLRRERCLYFRED
jgi:hypothetical protein